MYNIKYSDISTVICKCCYIGKYCYMLHILVCNDVDMCNVIKQSYVSIYSSR